MLLCVAVINGLYGMSNVFVLLSIPVMGNDTNLQKNGKSTWQRNSLLSILLLQFKEIIYRNIQDGSSVVHFISTQKGSLVYKDKFEFTQG